MQDVAPTARSAGFYRGALYRYYFLTLCCIGFFLSYADRQLFGALITPIKAEFNLSDTTLGLLSGLAFGLLYAVCSLPLARLVDRFSRKWILVACLASWSAATSACGLANSALTLGLARLAVGIGEAGGGPASMSAISDLFSKKWRATAISFYQAAGAIGGAVAIGLGAWLASEYGWRAAFIIAGVPGILLALLIALTVREPIRGEADGIVETGPVPSFRTTLKYILKRPTIVYTYFGAAASSAAVSVTSWLPAFFQRSHGLSLIEAGTAVGLALLVAGPFGEVIGGQVSDRIGRRSVSGVQVAMAGFALLTGISGVALVFSPTVGVAIAIAVAWKVVATAFPAPAYALSQSMVEVRMRATSMAILGLLCNLLGYGGGPALVGWLSEIYRPVAGEESLRWALASAFVILTAVAAGLYLASARSARIEARAGSAGPGG